MVVAAIDIALVGGVAGLVIAAAMLIGGRWWVRRVLHPAPAGGPALDEQPRREVREVPGSPAFNSPSPRTGPAPSATVPVVDVPAVAALPEIAPLADLIYRVPRGHVAHGVLPDGTLYTTPLYAIHHDIEVGDTGSGKSSSIHSKIVQYHYMTAQGYDIELYGADIKQELYNVWNRSRLMMGRIGRTVDDALQILRHLVDGPDGLHARQALYGEAAAAQNRVILNADDYAKVTGIQLAPKLFYLDELNVMLRELKDDKERRSEMMKLIFAILQMGRSSRVSLRAGSQYVTADILDREGSKQFVNRTLLGSWDRVAIDMLFGGVKLSDTQQALITGGKGRGIIKTASQGQPVPFQALWVDEPDILDAIESVQGYQRPGDWQLGALLPITTSRQSAPPVERDMREVRREVAPEVGAGSASEVEPTGNEKLIEGERAAVRQWLREGKGNEEIARLMFVPRRNQKRYPIINELRAEMELERNILHTEPSNAEPQEV